MHSILERASFPSILATRARTFRRLLRDRRRPRDGDIRPMNGSATGLRRPLLGIVLLQIDKSRETMALLGKEIEPIHCAVTTEDGAGAAGPSQEKRGSVYQRASRSSSAKFRDRPFPPRMKPFRGERPVRSSL